jgi:hypothetical protein
MDKFIPIDNKHRIKETTIIENNKIMVRNILQERFLFFFWISKTILFPLPQQNQTLLPDGFIIKDN